MATFRIREVHVGQSAEIRMLAFTSRAVDRVAGKVIYVGADRQIDESTRQHYYLARIETTEEALREAGDLKLQPVMPVEVYIQGRSRTVLAYLMEPITAVINRAGRE